LGWVKLEHSSDQVLELFTEEISSIWLVLGVCFPEEISSVSTEESVEGIFWDGLGEGWVLSESNEEDDRASEEID